MRSIALFSSVLIFSASVAWAPHAGAAEPREMQAREAFAAGRYQDALDIYVKLYAEQLHPVYLRNIGRCYQNLGNADKAASSFREYLRKARKLSPEERSEIEGYIAEMDALKKSQELKATAEQVQAPPEPRQVKEAPPVPPPSTVAVAVAASDADARPVRLQAVGVSGAGRPDLAPGAAQAAVTSSPSGTNLATPRNPTSEDREARPFYQRWWFWALTGGVVAAGFAGAAAAGAFTTHTDAPCPIGTRCQ